MNTKQYDRVTMTFLHDGKVRHKTVSSMVLI